MVCSCVIIIVERWTNTQTNRHRRTIDRHTHRQILAFTGEATLSVAFFVGVVAVTGVLVVAATGRLTSGSLLLRGIERGVGAVVSCTSCDCCCCCNLANLFDLTSLPASSITVKNTTQYLHWWITYTYTKKFTTHIYIHPT